MPINRKYTQIYSQLVVQETCNSKGLAVIRSCTIHYKMLCPNKYLREIEPFY